MSITSEMARNCPIRWDDYTKQERQRDSLGVGIKTGEKRWMQDSQWQMLTRH